MTSYRSFSRKTKSKWYPFTILYKFGDYVYRIYPLEIKIKDTTNTGGPAW